MTPLPRMDCISADFW